MHASCAMAPDTVMRNLNTIINRVATYRGVQIAQVGQHLRKLYALHCGRVCLLIRHAPVPLETPNAARAWQNAGRRDCHWEKGRIYRVLETGARDVDGG